MIMGKLLTWPVSSLPPHGLYPAVPFSIEMLVMDGHSLRETLREKLLFLKEICYIFELSEKVL